MKICSLFPSATEILFALGLGDEVVGVTHECLFPPEAQTKPRVVTSVIDQDRLESPAIDRLVQDHLKRRKSLYRIDEGLLNRLQPDLLVTQQLCDVCAIDAADVMTSIRSLSFQPTVISLHPHTLREALDDVMKVGQATGREAEAAHLLQQLEARIERVRQAVQGATTLPRVMCLEWLEPLMACGHWMPGMVELAGGIEVLGKSGEPSRAVAWEEIRSAQPEVLVLMPCGFPIERTKWELHLLQNRPGWDTLPAVKHHHVYLVNGPAYFNQSGPRLIDGLEILAGVIHPTVGVPALPAGAVESLEAVS